MTTGTVIQIEASISDIIPEGSLIRNGMGSAMMPRLSSALLTNPTVALKNQANWKPMSTGANIIGIIEQYPRRARP